MVPMPVASTTYVNGPLEELPAANLGYDLVIAVRLLSHVQDWSHLVAELCRVARRSVVLDYPSKSGMNALTPLLFGLKKSLEGNTRTYASFSESELRAEFARHGFVIGRSVRQFALPMVVHRVGKGAAPLRWLESLLRVVGLTALIGSPVVLRMDRQ
jgi:ubiquinone/menaquinone biosynthesis C-methylase UbiE